MGGYDPATLPPRQAGGRRRFVALIAAAVTVLALLSVFAIELSDTQAKSKRDVIARVHERSVLAAALIESLLQNAEQQLPQIERIYGRRVVSSQTMNQNRQGNMYLALLGPTARVLASSSGFTPQAHADLTHSAALALVGAGHPYGLGNVLPYGRIGVVNFAVKFPTPYGERYLLTGLSPAALSSFLLGELRRIPGVKGSHNYVIDGNDMVLASTNPARPAGYRFTTPAVVAALSHQSGERQGRYYDETPISNSTWRIILASPVAPLFASVTGWRHWLPWLIFAAFAVVALAALGMGLRFVRSAQIDLRAANAQLAEVNRELAQANQALAYDALHDPLTGLPNRTLFMDRLGQLIERSQRDPSVGCAVLFVDLDRFKPINDRYSHAVGDQVLAAIGSRFQGALRPGDTVGRIGGDEFAVLLDGVRTPGAASVVARRVQVSLAEPIEADGHTLTISASVGIALGSPEVSADELLRQADLAMYEAKRGGKGNPGLFGQTLTLA